MSFITQVRFVSGQNFLKTDTDNVSDFITKRPQTEVSHWYAHQTFKSDRKSLRNVCYNSVILTKYVPNYKIISVSPVQYLWMQILVRQVLHEITFCGMISSDSFNHGTVTKFMLLPNFKKINLIILTIDANQPQILKLAFMQYPPTNNIFQSAMTCLDCAVISFSQNVNIRNNRRTLRKHANAIYRDF